MLTLVCLSLGTFALGTGAFIIAGVLPQMSADLGVDPAQTGLLVTAFALVYAIGGPPLAAFTAHFNARRLALGALAVYVVATLGAVFAPDYWTLLATRIVTATGAAIYSPLAATLAVASVAPERRGRALAIIAAGVSLSNVIGVPIGAWLGNWVGWRASFGLVAALAVLAIIGLFFTLPADVPRSALRLPDLVRTAMQGRVLAIALVTVLWSIAGFVIYIYIVPLTAALALADHDQASLVLMLYGISAVAGTSLAGVLLDRVSAAKLVGISLVVCAVSLVCVSLLAFAPSAANLVPFIVLVCAWSLASWLIYPAQQARLFAVAPEAGAIVLSLNASALYLGMAIGAAIGGLALRGFGIAALGLVAAIIMLAPLPILLYSTRRASR
jgi:predicted MFS family arabinose efflux permease